MRSEKKYFVAVSSEQYQNLANEGLVRNDKRKKKVLS